MTGPTVGYVCADPGIPPAGTKGASIHYRELGRALTTAGVRVYGVSPRAVPPDGDLGFPLIVCPPASASTGQDSLGRELLQLLAQDGVRAALEQTVPLDAIYERYSLFGLGGLAYARSNGLPFILEVNAPLWIEAKRYRSLRATCLARSVAQELFRAADRILPVSSALADHIVREGAPADRVVVIPNGVHERFLEDGPTAALPGSLAGRPVVVFVGSLKEWHGVEFLIEAFTSGEHPGAGLWIVGDGPLRTRVERAALKWPNRIAHQPSVDHEGVPSILRASSAAVAPYTSDAPDYFSPLKVIEALAVGLPVLASRTTPNLATLDSGTEAWWFDAGNREDFRGALANLLNDLSCATARARVQRSVVERTRTWSARATELAQLIVDLVGERALQGVG